MIRMGFVCGGVAAALLSSLTGAACGQDPGDASAAASEPASQPEPEFMRFVDLGEGAARLESAIVEYEDAKGRKVDLIGAIHIADPAYYKRLNEEFRGYESLLYEMVREKKGEVEPASQPASKPQGGGDSVISLFQRGMQRALDLEFQLDGIDYGAENFVHADMSPKEFMASMDAKGESFLTMFMNVALAEFKRTAAEGGDAASAGEGPALLLSLLAKDRARRMKYILGRKFGDMEKMASGLGAGPKGGSTILIERNKAALKVLDEQLEAGKTHLAIFYGAAHLPDMEQRLVKERGFTRKETRWLTAWDIPKP